MGLSLADAAVRGTTFPTIAEQKHSLLSAGDTEGLIALNHSLFGSATMMAKEDDADDEDDSDDEDDDEDDDADDDEDDSDDEDDDAKGKKRKQDPRDVRIQELSAEAKKRRIRARQDRQRISDLEAENAQLKGKGKKSKDNDDDEDDDKSADSEELTKTKDENKALKERLLRQEIRQEFVDFVTSPKAKIKFKDPKVAFRLLDLDDVEVDEDDGEVDGLEDAIKDLAKKAPYLLVDKDEDKDEDDEDEDKPRRRKTGQRTGGTRKKGQPNRDALIKKYGIKR